MARGYTLRPVAELKPSRAPGLREVLEEASHILEEWAVEPLTLARDVVEEASRLEALRLIGVRLAPISLDSRDPVSLDELDPYWDLVGPPGKVYWSTLDLLTRGWPTPLVRLGSLSGGARRAWGKLEMFNPFSFSVKDRVGWALVEDYIRRHRRPPGRVYEATSTNTGMALAAMAAIYGFKLRAYIPASIQRTSDTLLRVMGAEVVRIPKPLTVDAIGEVKEEAARDGAVNLDQFSNDANLMVHVRYTAREIDYQSRTVGLDLEGVIGGIGTSGHMSAISFYMKHRSRGRVRIYCVQPAPGERIPGIRRVETGMKWLPLAEPDRIVDVTLAEAIEGVKMLARGDGILVGLSSGAVVAAYRKLAEEGALGEGDYILVLPDNGLKYVEQLSRLID